MRDLKFKKIKAINILCFGKDGIEIKFSDFGNVVQMHGVNLDAPGTEESPASNGAGKSSIQELLSIGLFGRTVKNPTKNKGSRIVNVLADKGQIEIEWDDFRLVRSFKKSKSGTVSSKLDLWQSAESKWDDESQITFGTSDETQKFILEKIGLSHHAFCNVVIFDDSNTYSFLEADAATKRQMVENLLDLEQYRDYFNNCKDIHKNIKKNISDLTKDYENYKNEIESCEKRIETIKQQESNWKFNKQKEIKELIVKIKEKQNVLENSDSGVQLTIWQESQDKIASLTDDITDLESKRDKVLNAIKTAREKLDKSREERMNLNESIQNHSLTISTFQEELSKASKLIKNLENLEEGNTCPTCHGIINKENYLHVINHGKEVISSSNESIKNKEYKIEELRKSYGQKSANITTIEEKITEAELKVANLENKLKENRALISDLGKVIKPEGSAFEQVVETEITELKKQLKNKKEEYEGFSPYEEIMEQAKNEKEEKENEKKQKVKELEEAESDLPYYEFWMEAFGDAGIRKFIIDSIIPALNEKVAYWLEILIDGLIEVTFNNKLEEKITRNGNEAFYHNMSKGEIRRINLAVSQSFSHIMMLNSGCCPSIVFLDEITGGGIDKAGVPYVYNMIFELAKERQVFVTTHNDILVNLLQGCESLTLKKHKDITVVVR